LPGVSSSSYPASEKSLILRLVDRWLI